MGLLRHAGEPGFVPPGLYLTNWGHTTQAFYFLALWLSHVVSLDAASRSSSR